MSEKKPELFAVTDAPKPEDGYEKQEILGRKTLFWFAFVHFGGIVFFMILTAILVHYWIKDTGPGNVELPPGAPARVLPPLPRLQADPHRDMAVLHIKDEDLHKYSYNKDTGVVHVPIDRAIDIIAREGLPHRETEGGGDGR